MLQGATRLENSPFMLVFGVATGGVGLVAIGIFAAVAGYGGGKAGEWAGKKTAETVNSVMD